MIKIFLTNFKKIVERIENSQTPIGYFLITFLAIITLRNFLEVFSTKLEFGEKIGAVLFHFSIAYIALASFMIILFYFLTKEPIAKIIKVVLVGFSIIPLPPLIDLIVTQGNGFKITYLLPELHDQIVIRFFTFFGNFEDRGVSLGIKVEIALVLLGSFLYFFTKNKNLIKNLIFTFFVYVTIFSFFAVPFVIRFLFNLLNLNYDHSIDAWEILYFYFLVILITGTGILYLSNKKKFILVIKDSRPARMAYYITMFVAGLTIALSNKSIEITANDILSYFFIIISIATAWLFSVITNNITDYDIDKISNQNRPLINSDITINDYQKIAVILIAISIFYSVAVNVQTLFFIGLFIGNYFIYSMPPLRFKRVLFFSKLTIALNSLILILLGFFTVTKTLDNFPLFLFPLILVGITTLANFIDIKDYEGDKNAGIKTLPTVLGLKNAKIVIGLSFTIFYLILYFSFKKFGLGDNWNFLLILLGLLQFYLINKKKYRDIYVVGTCILTTILIILI